MAQKSCAADILVRALSSVGVKRFFTLSGNQIMPIFDACIDAEFGLVHVRHEAAAVHMADAWGRLTGEPGVALVTAGPGMANTLSALYVALMAESPMVLLSGRAPVGRPGSGVFQDMAQAEMASHVTKASWTVTDPSDMGRDIARAFRVARSGRPGPVHLALPFDVLETSVAQPDEALPRGDEFQASISSLGDAAAEQVLDALAEAERPLVLGGPAIMRGPGTEILASLSEATHAPVVCTESPRGINDPSLGAFAEVLRKADLIVLLGKKLDFALRFGAPPEVDSGCRFIQIDSEATALAQTRRRLEDSSRLLLAEVADPLPAAQRLRQLADKREWAGGDWNDEVREAVSYRPPSWSDLRSSPDSGLHAVEVCRAAQELLDGGDDAVFISDGGEFGQWSQACMSAPHRIVNGPSGAIGNALPFALAARLAFPDSPVVTMLGDGTFGFLAMEFDTAVRCGLPFVAVVGNDATWNAEYQIQLRQYGEGRLVGCELLPARYDQVVSALGGHGEHVSAAAELKGALERAFASGRPACVNVDIGRNASPVVRRNR